MIQISIIVPVFNSEKHLEECMNSILNQTFQNFELICLNDASVDSSGNILSKFQKKKPEIQIINHKDRQGAARTRNHGLEYAKAPYVVFWDSDEVYVSDLLEKMYASAISYDADLVLVERGIIKTNPDCIIPENSNQYEKYGFDNKTFSLLDLLSDGLCIWPSSPVNRMVKRQLLEDHHLRYQDLQSSNDVFFADMTMILAEKIIHINDWDPKVYVRRDVQGSISMNRDPFCSFYAFQEIKNYLVENEKWNKYKAYVVNQFIAAVKSEMQRCSDEDKKKRYFKFLQREGIANICEKQEIEYIISNMQMGSFFKDFLEEPYEMRCWEKSRLMMQLEDNRERIAQLIHYFEKNHLNVTLWGAGKWGSDMLTYCKKEFSFEFDFWVDNSKDLIGSYIKDKRVSSFMEVKDKTDIIVITNIKYKKDIIQQVKSVNLKIKVFSLPQYLGNSIMQCME